MVTCGPRQRAGIVQTSRCAEVLVECGADFLLLQVNCGGDDVARWLVAELHDPLSEIRVDHVDAAVLEVGIETAFLGQHRLALDEPLRAARRENLVDDLVMLIRIACPVHPHAIPDCIGLELLEILVESREGVLLDRRCELTQQFPLGNGGGCSIALLAQKPDRTVVPVDARGVCQEACARGSMVHALPLPELRKLECAASHERAAPATCAVVDCGVPEPPWLASTSATCIIGRLIPSRAARPFMCITHERSVETTTSARAAR